MLKKSYCATFYPQPSTISRCRLHHCCCTNCPPWWCGGLKRKTCGSTSHSYFGIYPRAGKSPVGATAYSRDRTPHPPLWCKASFLPARCLRILLLAIACGRGGSWVAWFSGGRWQWGGLLTSAISSSSINRTSCSSHNGNTVVVAVIL